MCPIPRDENYESYIEKDKDDLTVKEREQVRDEFYNDGCPYEEGDDPIWYKDDD